MQAQKKYEEQNLRGLANLRPEREELHLEQQVRLLLKDPNTDRFLFVQEQKADGTLSNHIKTVGGIRKPQETLEDAIHREVEEEVGLNIKPQSLHPLTVFTDRREKEVGGTLRVTSSTVHFYYGTLVEDKFPPEGPVTTNVREDEQGNKTAFFHYLSSAEIQHAQSKKGLKIFEATNKAVRYFLDKSY
ncbi:NUDIX hydrolase, partial [Candidatus Woesearchaeota archaeon]